MGIDDVEGGLVERQGCAVGGSSRGRLFFLAPWRGVTIAGTSHDPWTSRADVIAPRREDVAQLLADLQAAFPRAAISAALASVSR